MAKTTKQKIIKGVGYIPVVLCLCAFSWGYYTFVFIYCFKKLPLMGAPEPLKFLLITISHLLLLLSVWSYLMVVFVHPGSPARALAASKDYLSTNPDDETNLAILNLTERESERPVIESQQLQSIFRSNETEGQSGSAPNFHMITVKQNGEKRFCRKCDFEKPDRSHHCSVCGECILKMDHHCPWINNCVGFHNQKFFLLFIFYTAILCIVVVCSLAPGLLELVRGKLFIDIDDIQLAFLGFISGLFGIMLVCFVGFHIYLLFNNRTTIENLERTVYKVDQRGSPTSSKYLNIFDIGSYRNFTEVMGRKPYLWFLPFISTEGSGIIYPLSSYAYNLLSSTE